MLHSQGSGRANTQQLASATGDVSHVVVFGRDQKANGKYRASKFKPTESEQAEKAARLMGFKCWRVPEEHRRLVAQIPFGRLGGTSDKANFPIASAKVIAKLEAASRDAASATLTTGTGKAAGDQPKGAPAKASEPASGPSAPGTGSGSSKGTTGPSGGPTLPPDWGSIGPGSLVLARWENDVDQGWWEAITVRLKTNGTLDLVWRDYKDEPGFVRRLEEVALLHQSFKQP